MVYKLIAAAAAMMVAPAVQAQTTLFSENFDNQGTPGSSQLNFNAFTQFTVTGQVDLVNSPDFSITCAGKCIDLDGTSGPGGITSRAINFSAGQALTISFDVGGSQRSTDRDPFSFNLVFASPTNVNSFVGVGGTTFGNLPNFTGYSYNPSIAGTSPFVTDTVTFTPTQSGSFTLGFSTTSADNVGPLLDNVKVVAAASAVPEPAAWSLMILGFGLAGTALRRRPARVAIA